MTSTKVSKPSSRVRNCTRSVKISSTAHGLTSQAGLIPIVKYLDRIGFEKAVKRGVMHSRGDNADDHLSDAVLLTLVGMIGGATSMTTIWADSVLRRVAGWIKIPVETQARHPTSWNTWDSCHQIFTHIRSELDKPQYALRPLQLRTKAATLKLPQMAWRLSG